MFMLEIAPPEFQHSSRRHPPSPFNNVIFVTERQAELSKFQINGPTLFILTNDQGSITKISTVGVSRPGEGPVLQPQPVNPGVVVNPPRDKQNPPPALNELFDASRNSLVPFAVLVGENATTGGAPGGIVIRRDDDGVVTSVKVSDGPTLYERGASSNLIGGGVIVLKPGEGLPPISDTGPQKLVVRLNDQGNITNLSLTWGSAKALLDPEAGIDRRPQPAPGRPTTGPEGTRPSDPLLPTNPRSEDKVKVYVKPDGVIFDIRDPNDRNTGARIISPNNPVNDTKSVPGRINVVLNSQGQVDRISVEGKVSPLFQRGVGNTEFTSVRIVRPGDTTDSALVRGRLTIWLDDAGQITGITPDVRSSTPLPPPVRLPSEPKPKVDLQVGPEPRPQAAPGRPTTGPEGTRPTRGGISD